MQVWSAPGFEKPDFKQAIHALANEPTKPYRKGDWLGPSWTNHWVKVDLTIPESFAKSDEPVLCGS